MLAPSRVAAAAESVRSDGGLVDESAERLEVAGTLNAAAVAEWREISSEASTLGLTVSLYDVFNEPVNELTEAVRQIILQKTGTASTCYFFTVAGFRKLLFEEARVAKVRRVLIAGEKESFSTRAFMVEPWTSMVADDAEPKAPPPPSPRQFVRDLGAGVVPASVADAMLTSSAPASSAAFVTWRAVALTRLRVALATEAWRRDGATVLGLAGQRYVEVAVGDEEDEKAFPIANEAAQWVYEGSDVASRLVLFTAELARDWPNSTTWSAGFLRLAPIALATAQRAQRQQLVERSTETLKSLGELRKGLGDEISRTIQATRDLVAASWRDFAVAIAALVARLTIFTGQSPRSIRDGRVLVVVVCVFLALTFGVTFISNWRFNHNMAKLREAWRLQLYAYLSDEEYRANVIEPLQRVARIYYLTALPLGLAYLGLIVMLIAFGFSGDAGTTSSNATTTSTATSSPSPNPRPTAVPTPRPSRTR